MTEASFENFVINVSHSDGQISIDGEIIRPDIARTNELIWHVVDEHKSYKVFIQKVDRESREVTLSVNGKKTTVKLRSRIEILLKELGIDQSLKKKVDSLKAPMPGLIFKMLVKEGDEVKQGDPLVVLEAMKMENILKSPVDAVISRIHVVEKEAVEKNALLLNFE